MSLKLPIALIAAVAAFSAAIAVTTMRPSTGTHFQPTPPRVFAQEPTPAFSSSVTADDIAGTGSEIADASKPKFSSPPIAELELAYGNATKRLESALAAVNGSPVMAEFSSYLAALPTLQTEYVTARRSGATADVLREIARRYATNVRAALTLWQDARLADLQNADSAFVDAGWNLRRALRERNVESTSVNDLSPALTAWNALDAIRVNASLYIMMDVRDALQKKADNGETVDDAVRERELLKGVVIFLEKKSQ